MAGKVTGGLLDEPYPIKTRGDVSRAKVLPNVRHRAPIEAGARAAAKKAAPPAQDDTDQPASGFDYVVKRNRMLKKISTRANGRAATRRA